MPTTYLIDLRARTMVALGLIGALAAAAAFGTSDAAAETYTPTHPSQSVECNLVDSKTAQTPHLGPGPGGWRYSNSGGSFVTFAQTADDETDPSLYQSVAGRSNVGSNTGQINDYPDVLDLPQQNRTEILEFNKRHGVIVLSGGDLFQLPGQDNGEVRINVHDPDGDGTYEGCAKTPQLTNFGFTKKEGGDFVQQEYFKAYAETNSEGVVTFYEWTEISLFKDTTVPPGDDG